MDRLTNRHGDWGRERKRERESLVNWIIVHLFWFYTSPILREKMREGERSRRSTPETDRESETE